MTAIAVLLLTHLTTLTFAANPPDQGIESIGHLGGTCGVVAPFGDYVLAVRGNRLLVMAKPGYDDSAVVGELKLPATANCIGIAGEHVYIGSNMISAPTNKYPLWTIDLADVTAPVLVSTYESCLGHSKIVIDGDRAFVRSFFNIVEVMDISNPSTMIPVTSIHPPISTETTTDIEAAGPYVYVATNNHRFGVVDIAFPNAFVGQYQASHFIQTIVLDGHTCYLLGDGVITALDVSDPAHPAPAGSLDIGDFQGIMCQWGNYLYATVGRDLVVVDKTDPAHLVERGRAEFGTGSSSAIVADAGMVYVNEYLYGYAVVNAIDPDHPSEAGYFSTPYFVTAVSAAKDYALIGTFDGAAVIDVRDPTKPAFFKPFPGQDFIRQITQHGSRVYVAQWDKILSLRCDTVLSPVLLGSFSAIPQQLYAQGDALYFSGKASYTDDSGIAVLDVSHNSPSLTSFTPLWGQEWSRRFDVSGDLLVAGMYHATEAKDILDKYAFYSIADPAALEPVSEILPARSAYDMKLSSHYAYLSDYNKSFIYDIADPGSPVLLSTLEPTAGRLAVYGNLLVCPGGYGNLVIYDVSNADAPAEIGRIRTYYSDLSMRNDIIYAAGQDQGLEILRITADLPEWPAPTRFSASDGTTDVVKLRWDKMSGADRYDVWRYDSQKEGPTKLASTPDPFFTDTNVVADTPYRYEVTAVFGDNTSPASEIDIGFVGSVTKPHLAVTPGETTLPYSSGQIEIHVENVGLGNMAWNAAIADAEWIRIVSDESGIDTGIITLEYDANTTESQRMAQLLVVAESADNTPVAVSISQRGHARLKVTGPQEPLSHRSSRISLTVQNAGDSPLTWSAEVVNGDWLSIGGDATGAGDGTIKLKASENTGFAERNATVRITAFDAIESPMDFHVTQLDRGTLEIVAPAGGEIVAVGDKLPIRWKSYGDVGPFVRIELLRRGSVTRVLDKRAANDGRFVWRVGDDIAPKAGYYIHVVSLINETIHDVSGGKFEVSK